MSLKRGILFFCAIIAALSTYAQNKAIDSLKQVYNANPQSENGVSAAYQIAKLYDHINKYDSALYFVNAGINTAHNLKDTKTLVGLLNTKGNVYNLQGDYKNAAQAYNDALKIADSLKDEVNTPKLLNNLGTLAERIGEYSKAYKYFSKALTAFTETNQPKGITESYTNIALVYHDQGNNGKAIEYNLKALKIEEGLNEPYMLGNTLTNIGNIYNDQRDEKLAVEYYNKALVQYDLAKSRGGSAYVYEDLGLVYKDKGAYDTALAYLKKALNIASELGQKRGVADDYASIGNTYSDMRDWKNATENIQKSIDMYKEMGDEEGLSESLNNLGKAYLDMNKIQDAMKMEEQALVIAKKINSPTTESEIHENLSMIYEKLNLTNKAYDNYKSFVRLKDSLNSQENSRALMKAQLAHQFEQDQQAAALKEEKRLAVEQETERRQKAILYFVISTLVLALVFAGIMVNRFYLIRRQKHTIEAQKSEVENKNKIIEEKNKDITDSINYARDIQRALMPNEQEVKQMFPDSFVLYMPKDIVSGDFYWMAEKDGKAMLLAADCTGHGVPGALMSMIGVSLFNETVEKKDIVQPGQILNEVRSGIINTFKQTGNTQHKDGMDAALCCIDLKTLKAEFAGAYNPMWILTKSGETREIAPDKQPIGIQEGQKPTFTTQTISLEKGDTLYLFSDGYADQFGGPNGKKFKYKQLQQLIIDNVQLTMQEQKAILEKNFLEWKGSLDQVDDVLIIGVRV